MSLETIAMVGVTVLFIIFWIALEIHSRRNARRKAQAGRSEAEQTPENPTSDAPHE